MQDATSDSLVAVSGAQLVLEQSAAPISELDAVLDGQRWVAEPDSRFALFLQAAAQCR